MKKTLLFALFLVLISCSSSEENNNPNNPDNSINEALNRQAVGSSANNLLANTSFSNLVVEVAFFQDTRPSQEALDNFRNFILARCNKTAGIEFIYNEIPSPDRESYTIEQIADVERDFRTRYNQGNTIAVWALFVDGGSENDTNNARVLGAAYWNTSFVIFQKTIQDIISNNPTMNQIVLETSVINHEFGHLLGLTNLGTPMQTNHEDPNNPRHCDESDCLMFFQTETSQGIGNMISGGNIPTLDDQCLAYLRANGGK